MTGFEKTIIVIAGTGSLLTASALLEIVTGRSFAEIDEWMGRTSNRLRRRVPFPHSFLSDCRKTNRLFLTRGIPLLLHWALSWCVVYCGTKWGMTELAAELDAGAPSMSTLSISYLIPYILFSMFVSYTWIQLSFDLTVQNPLESAKRMEVVSRVSRGVIVSCGAVIFFLFFSKELVHELPPDLADFQVALRLFFYQLILMSILVINNLRWFLRFPSVDESQKRTFILMDVAANYAAIGITLFFIIVLVVATLFHYFVVVPLRAIINHCARRTTQRVIVVSGACLILTSMVLAVFCTG